VRVAEELGLAGVLGLEAGRGILFFTAWDPDHGRELWASDGTAAGTRRVTDLHPGAFPESAYSSEAGFLDTRTLVVAGRRAYFTAYDAETGWELWTSDGTVAGTRVVKDIWEGGDSYPYHLTAALERVFFTAYDPGNGRELWTSDGTDAGTRRVAQIAPGAASAAPDALHFSGASLLFGADDGVAGREPWLVEVGPLTIRDLIERIEDLLDRGELSRGRAYSLISKLQLALWFLQYANGEGMAAVMLDLFVWEVEYDVRIGVLSAEEGEPLAEAARQALADLRAR
jgi:ELWxxDGT repeat protein